MVGPTGKQVVAVTELGESWMLNAATGHLLYQYQTGGYSVTSVADSNGNLYVASGSGTCTSFAVGGYWGADHSRNLARLGQRRGQPERQPERLGHRRRRTHRLGQRGHPVGRSLGPVVGCRRFELEVRLLRQPGHRGQLPAHLETWSLGLPVPTAGGQYSVTASADATNGQADVSGYRSAPSRRVAPSPSTTSPRFRAVDRTRQMIAHRTA